MAVGVLVCGSACGVGRPAGGGDGDNDRDRDL